MECAFLGTDSALRVFTAEERPELWARSSACFASLWPEYNNHGNDTGAYFGALVPRFAHLQVLVVEQDDAPVARGRTIPFHWDGSPSDLPGIDGVGLRAVSDHRAPNTLSALAAEVVADRQGRGISRLVLQAMAAVGARAGLGRLVAPVRPSRKDRYPLVPIDRYAHWQRRDGLPLDPWLRVHARLGATIVRTEPHSLRIEAPVDHWAAWTAMDFPEDGDYVFPQGLAPLRVHGGTGSYWEPNVWMLHPPPA